MAQVVSYALLHPSYEAYTWQIQDEHAPASQPPLVAWEDPPAGREPPRQLRINGYTYGRAGAAMETAPFGQAQSPQSVADLTRWREEWLPEVAKIESLFTTFEPADVGPDGWPALLESQDKEYWRVFGGVHRTAVMPARLAFARFVEAYVAMFGEARRADALILLQGFPNRSLDRAAALWDLSRLVREDPDLHRMLDQRIAPPVGSSFAQQLAGVVAEFGHTTNNGMLDLPTWGEDPAIPIALAGAYARQRDGRGPREAQARQRATRLRLEKELRAQAAYGNANAATLVTDMEMAQQLLPNLEDHNFLGGPAYASGLSRPLAADWRLALQRRTAPHRRGHLLLPQDRTAPASRGRRASLHDGAGGAQGGAGALPRRTASAHAGAPAGDDGRRGPNGR